MRMECVLALNWFFKGKIENRQRWMVIKNPVVLQGIDCIESWWSQDEVPGGLHEPFSLSLCYLLCVVV